MTSSGHSTCKRSAKRFGEIARTDRPERVRSAGQAHVYLAFGLLVLLGAAVKLPIWQLRPQVFSDSPGYLVPALNLLAGRGYGVQENGFRSPTYPLFLAAVLAPLVRTHLSECRDAHRPVCIDQAARAQDGAFALKAVTVTQAFMGLLTTAVLFAIGWTLTRNPVVAFLFGAGYALNLATAYWEISILTETLTTFLLALSVYLTCMSERLHGLGRTVLGIVLGALALCHMLFLVYWIIPASFVLLKEKNAGHGLGPATKRAAPIIAVPVLLLIGWSTFNYQVNGVFSPSIISGYITSQMVAPVLENAPQGYDDITELYVGYRNAVTAETGSYSGAIFRAWPAMLNASGMTFAELSQKLTTLSLYLVVAYPSSYLSVAGQAWQKFWDVSLYHYEPVPTGGPSWMLWFLDDNLQRFLTISFWITPAVMALVILVRRGKSRLSNFDFPVAPMLLMMTTVWFAAIIVTLTSFGDNSRYRSHVLPFQFGTIILIVWAIWQVTARITRRSLPQLEAQ